MDQPKFERMLRLMMLTTGNRRYNLQELADRVEMSARTVYRYMDTFREAVFVVKNQNGIWRIDKSSPYFKDISELVHFTEEEALVLKTAIDSIDDTHVLKQNLKKKLYTVYDYKILAQTTTSSKNAKIVNHLADAMKEGRQVILKHYLSSHSNTAKDRLTEPFEFTTNYISFWAYEPDSGMVKLFKTARVSAVEMGDAWQFRDKHQAGFMDLFRNSGPDRFRVKLRLNLRARNLIMEEYPLSKNFLTPDFPAENMPKAAPGKACDTNRTPAHWVLDVEVCRYEGIGRFVMGLLDDVEIVDSPEFDAFIQAKLHAHCRS